MKDLSKNWIKDKVNDYKVEELERTKREIIMGSKEILKKLVGFNTINDKENIGIINFIEQYLEEYGFKTEYKSNCLVMSNSDDCNIGFLGHTDTVSYSSDWTFKPFELTELDGRLYGLGTCDMKGAIAAILSSISKIDFSKTKQGIKLFFTYDEELGFSGIRELIDKKISFPKNIIVGEPTYNEVINASKGLLELKITFMGLSSHSSKPEEGVNAIEKCVVFINQLKDYYNKLKKETIDSKYATMNIGIISGGRSLNIVPDTCELKMDFRTISKKQNEKIIKTINKLIGKNATCEVINSVEPFISDFNNINMSDYITEASFIKSDNKLILGVGPINAHKKDEFITVDSLNKLEEQYSKIIKMTIENENKVSI
jgi:acetylornithine deacetylase